MLLLNVFGDQWPLAIILLTHIKGSFSSRLSAKAKAIFGSWAHSGFDPHEKYPIPAFKPLTQTAYFIKESSIAKTPYMMLQWQGPDTRTDSTATIAADVFSAILGLNSSKWQQALVDKGLASYSSLSYNTLKHVGPVQLFAVPNPVLSCLPCQFPEGWSGPRSRVERPG